MKELKENSRSFCITVHLELLRSVHSYAYKLLIIIYSYRV